MKTFYLTKYCLAAGILEVQGEISKDKYVSGNYEAKHRYFFFDRLGTEAFENLEEAKANVRKRITAKIKSLKKQMEKMEKLDLSGAAFKVTKK